MPVSRLLFAELLVCIITLAVVRECADSGGDRGVIAYIDPGSGSFIIQMLIAYLTGIIYLIRKFWGNIKGYCLNFLRKKWRPKRADEN